MNRTFATHGNLVHDPATGLTHQAPHPLPTGRASLDDDLTASWPVLAPAALHRSTPVSLCWSPIVRCNLACPQCLDDTTVSELAAPRRHRIADTLANADVLGVDISGGEPLLLRELPHLIKVIRDGRRSAVSVTTNGWHLQRRAPDLAAVADAIRVSLDGPTTASHDSIRGDGSFQRAIAGIRAAVTAGIPVQLQTVLMHRTAPHAQELVDIALALGARGLTVLQMLPIGAGASLPDQMLTDDQANAVLAALKVPPGLRVRLRTRDMAGNFTVVRADGRVWRNDLDALGIGGLHPLTDASDLHLTSRDGAA